MINMWKNVSIADKTPKGTSGSFKSPELIKMPIGSPKLGRCRVCGKPTTITTEPRYLLCQSCGIGIKID